MEESSSMYETYIIKDWTKSLRVFINQIIIQIHAILIGTYKS